MAGGALFVGWGDIRTGKDKAAGQVFAEAMQFYSACEQQGRIAKVEVVGLEVHGGDLRGFFLLHGDDDKLDQLEHSDDFRRLISRALAVVEGVGVVHAVTGQELGRRITQAEQDTADLI